MYNGLIGFVLFADVRFPSRMWQYSIYKLHRMKLYQMYGGTYTAASVYQHNATFARINVRKGAYIV